MDIVSTIAHLTTMLAGGVDVGDHEQIILAVVLDDARALQEALFIFLALENLLVGALDDIREVGLEFHHLARAVDDIHTTVVVEEQRAIVEVAHARDDGPGTLGLLGREDIGVAHATLFVGSEEGIELTIVVFQ